MEMITYVLIDLSLKDNVYILIFQIPLLFSFLNISPCCVIHYKTESNFLLDLESSRCGKRVKSVNAQS